MFRSHVLCYVMICLHYVIQISINHHEAIVYSLIQSVSGHLMTSFSHYRTSRDKSSVHLKLAVRVIFHELIIGVGTSVTFEEDNSLQLFAVEQVVEGPQTTLLTERVRLHVWVVTVNLTLLQTNLVVDRLPQTRTQLPELLSQRCAEVRVDILDHEAEIRFAGKLLRLRLAEIVIWKRGVQRRQQREQHFPVDHGDKLLRIDFRALELRCVGGVCGVWGEPVNELLLRFRR